MVLHALVFPGIWLRSSLSNHNLRWNAACFSSPREFAHYGQWLLRGECGTGGADAGFGTGGAQSGEPGYYGLPRTADYVSFAAGGAGFVWIGRLEHKSESCGEQFWRVEWQP